MFCSNCGKEVSDNAYACTGCGCLVGGKKAPDVGDKNTKLSVFILLSVVAVALTLLFFTLSFTCEDRRYLSFHEDVLIVSGLLAWLLVMPAGIVTLIFGVKEKRNAALKLIANITFSVCVAVFITMFICVICQL